MKGNKTKIPHSKDCEGFKILVKEPSGPDGTRTRDLRRDRAAF